MYEYKSRPSYHRPWHKRVHAFVPPPIPDRRRTQSASPLTRKCRLAEDSDSRNEYLSRRTSPARYKDSHCPNNTVTCNNGNYEDDRNDRTNDNDRISNIEIDMILSNIRRSKSNVSKAGFGHEVLKSEVRPSPPVAPPPPLPTRGLQDISNEYQRSPFGPSQTPASTSRRSRNRDIKKNISTQPQFDHCTISNNARRPSNSSHDSLHISSNSRPQVEISTSTENTADLNLTRNDTGSKRVSVTEEEIASIIEKHREKRRNSLSSFKIGSSRSPSVSDRLDKEPMIPKLRQNQTVPLNNSNEKCNALNGKESTSDKEQNIEHDISARRSRSNVKANKEQQMVTNITNTDTIPKINSSKHDRLQNQFSNIDVKSNHGHAKDYTKTSNIESNVNSKPTASTCVGVGNSNTKNNNIVDYNMTPKPFQLPEKPNKEVQTNTNKNSSRNDDSMSTTSIAANDDSLKNVAKKGNFDINDYVERNKKCNEIYGFSNKYDNASGDDDCSQSPESEQKEGDIELLSPPTDVKWNTNPTFVDDSDLDKCHKTTSESSSIHSNYNNLLKNIASEEEQQPDDFGKVSTEEGDKDVEEVLRDFKQRLDDMGEYLDRVKEAAVRLSDAQSNDMERNSELTTPNKVEDFEDNISQVNITKNNVVDEKSSLRKDDKSSPGDVRIDMVKNEKDENSNAFNEVTCSISNINEWCPEKEDDIDTSITMTIPITRMYTCQDPLPEYLTDDFEKEIQCESTDNEFVMATEMNFIPDSNHEPIYIYKIR